MKKDTALYPHEHILRFLAHSLIIFTVIPFIATIALLSVIIAFTTTGFYKVAELAFLAVISLAFLFFVFREC
jgi:hypothetical protein